MKEGTFFSPFFIYAKIKKKKNENLYNLIFGNHFFIIGNQISNQRIIPK